MIAIANGIGMQRAVAAIHTAAAISGGFSGICSIGTGGALDPGLSIADVVIATEVTSSERKWPALDPHGPPARSGPVYSSPRIVRTSEEKKNLHETGAILVEMEAAGVAVMAKELAVPFYCVRAVSDLANESFFINFEEFLLPDGQFNVAGLMRFAVWHPFKGLPELLRLQENTAKAAKQLGEFLANCNF
jgi:nucleoside phosphorylase